jgi:hypothetical protein
MKNTIAAVIAVTYVMTGAWALRAQQPAGDGPRYGTGNTLIRPADYREWPFLGAGLGLTYEPESVGAQSTAPQMFSNVFVNPSSYRHFMQTGTWKDGTIFVLEFRASGTASPPNTTGKFQTGLMVLEAEVKDSRFPNGWAFFEFGRGAALREAAEPLGGTREAGCIECHTKHTAVERTFVQFYPTLLDVARAKGTLKPGY